MDSIHFYDGKEKILMEKLIMFVYSDLKTDARVMRSIDALKDQYDITILATNSSNENKVDGYRYLNVIDMGVKNPLVRYLKCIKKVCSYIKHNDCDALYCHDYYAAPVLLVSLICNRSRKMIYDAHELYIPNASSSIREKITFFIEKRAIQKADLVICASERRKEIMKKNFPVKKDIEVINNISILPQEHIDFTDNQEVDLFLSNQKKTVVYCGALMYARRPDLLIDAAESLQDKIQVLIIGNGDEKAKLKQRVMDRGLSNVRFMDSIPYKSIYGWISRCDIGYLYYDNNNLNNSNCAPNKIFEYASAGLPMVGNENPGLTDYFSRYSIGETNDDIVKAINGVIEKYDIYKRSMGKFLNDFSWEKEKKRLLDAVDSVVRGME